MLSQGSFNSKLKDLQEQNYALIQENHKLRDSIHDKNDISIFLSQEVLRYQKKVQKQEEDARKKAEINFKLTRESDQRIRALTINNEELEEKITSQEEKLTTIKDHVQRFERLLSFTRKKNLDFQRIAERNEEVIEDLQKQIKSKNEEIKKKTEDHVVRLCLERKKHEKEKQIILSSLKHKKKEKETQVLREDIEGPKITMKVLPTRKKREKVTTHFCSKMINFFLIFIVLLLFFHITHVSIDTSSPNIEFTKDQKTVEIESKKIDGMENQLFILKKINSCLLSRVRQQHQNLTTSKLIKTILQNEFRSKEKKLRETIDELYHDYSEAYDDYSEAYDDYSTLFDEVEKLKLVKSIIKNELHSKIAQNNELKKSIEFLNFKIHHLNNFISKKDEDIIKISQERDFVVTENKRMMEMNTRIKQKNDFLQKLNENDRTASSRLVQKLQKNINSLQKSNAEFATIATSRILTFEQTNKDLQNDLVALNKEKKALLSKIDELKGDIETKTNLLEVKDDEYQKLQGVHKESSWKLEQYKRSNEALLSSNGIREGVIKSLHEMNKMKAEKLSKFKERVEILNCILGNSLAKKPEHIVHYCEEFVTGKKSQS